MEQSVIINRYGAKLLLSKIYCYRIDKDASRSCEQYTIDIVEGQRLYENRHDIMKIYTNGRLEEITSGRYGQWKVSPIVKMPYGCYGIYHNEIDMVDPDGKFYTLELYLDHRDLKAKGTDYSIDVAGVLDQIVALKDFIDLNHLLLDKAIKATDKAIKSHATYDSSIDKCLEEAKSRCEEFKSKEKKYSEVPRLYNTYQKEILNLEETIEEKYKNQRK
ncbi:MAG: hypothetical protein ACI3ZY_13950 [Parabacteroides sp.]